MAQTWSAPAVRRLALLAILQCAAAAAAVAPAALDVPLIDGAITLDGALEPAWQQAAYFAVGHQFRPLDGRPAPVRTDGYIARQQDALLVAFVCADPQIGALRASLTDRDRILGDDLVGIVLDTYGDHRQAYEFLANAHGVQADLLWHADRAESDDADALWQANGGEDDSFDAVWQAAGRVYTDHWVVEMRLPLAMLRYPAKPEQRWSVHFVRVYPRDNVYQLSWQPISQDSNSFMGQAGTLALTLDPSHGFRRQLELLPFVTASRTDLLVDDGTGRGVWRNQDDHAWNASHRVGLTGKYTWSSGHAIDFAFRPDFSQIESDAGRIDANSPFAFFYDERRPFFMEGKDVFLVDYVSSGMVLDVANLIYTRSINDPRFAAKATGRSGPATYGIISAYDVNTPLVLPLADGTVVRRTTENSLSTVARLKYQLGGQSHVGVAATNRRFDQGGSNTATTVETALRLSDDYTLTAFGGVTYTDEPADSALSSLLPDVTFRAGGKTITVDFDGQRFYGRVLKATLLRQSRHLNFNASLQDYTPGFRADNSAIFSNDGRLAHALVSYNVLFDSHPLLSRIRPSTYIWRKVDHDGQLKDTGVRPELQVQFARQTTLNVGGFLFNKERYREVDFDHARTLWAWVSTRALQRVSAFAYINRGRSINRFGQPGAAHNPLQLVPTLDAQFSLGVRPTDQLTDDFSYEMLQLRTDAERRLIVRQQILRNSLHYQVSRRLFVRLVTDYEHVRRAVAAGAQEASATFSVEPLVSYKLNPFTVFYVGGNLAGAEDPFPGREGLARTGQTVFMKFQYLWDTTAGQ